MDLFDYERDKVLEKNAPLAYRMRPRKLEEFIGQQHIVGKNTFLYKSVKANRVTSVILHGRPGVGKTTLGKIIAGENNFIQLNATTSGVKDIKEAVKNSKENILYNGKKTILFIDEIHRFSKSQQDTLLPYVEDGTVTLVGATTENPFYEVNNALISRSKVLKLDPLTSDDIKKIIDIAIKDKKRGLGNYNVRISEKGIEYLCDISSGDARVALNTLEIAVLTTDVIDGKRNLTEEILKQCGQKKIFNYDKGGDNHYDYASAFIKSIRGSDPDAGLYYLAVMLKGGEDPKFIARRLIISASEDIGNADPHGLMVATNAMTALNFVGMPEARIILAQATTYLASASKSNASYLGIKKAMESVEKYPNAKMPKYLRDKSYADQKTKDAQYKYPPNYEGSYVKQQYLPDELVGEIFYEPNGNGVELRIKDKLERIRGIKNEL